MSDIITDAADAEYLLSKKKQGSIVDALQEAILSGRIPGGTEMTQTELADTLGVSRMPVREALLILEHMGLVERLPNNHVRVAAQEERSYRDIFRLAAYLEHSTLEEQAASAEKRAAEIPGHATELQIHRAIYARARDRFVKQTLKTAVEIYIARAVATPGRDQAHGAELLQGAILADGDARREGLNVYFESLLADLPEEENTIRESEG